MSRDIETRAGLDDLSVLHAKRNEMVKSAANIYARYGPFGTAEARRKSALALAELQVRHDLAVVAEKATEAKVDALARTHPTYLSYLDAMEEGRADWLVLENNIQSITDNIQRGPALARYAAAEVGLRQGGA